MLKSEDCDLVLRDLQMPVIDGYTAAANVSESGKYARYCTDSIHYKQY
ncbi:MAG TPA: hypothetical protein VGN20_19620 [Mucilaginibacter sp.]